MAGRPHSHELRAVKSPLFGNHQFAQLALCDLVQACGELLEARDDFR